MNGVTCSVRKRVRRLRYLRRVLAMRRVMYFVRQLTLLHTHSSMPSAAAPSLEQMSEPSSASSADMEGQEALTEITNVEVDAMLEIAPKYCTRIRHCESMKYIPELPQTREDVPISSAARVLLLHNLLTPAECQHYIRETEALVYRDLDGEFDADYRSNQRVLVLSEKLADHIYARMKLQLNRSDVLRVRPMCFGNSGTWKPVRLNECFKFGKYQQKQHFGTHIDGPWVPRTDESSIYTVLIYLNDDFTGGRTVFIPEEQRSQMDAKITEMRRTQCEEYDQIGGGGGGGGGAAAASVSSPFVGYTTNADGVVSILPRRGSALLFTHDTLHAGLPIITGCKYVMRTELMFHRVDSEMIPPSIRDSYVNDPAYQRTLKFYRESHEKNMKGDVTGFTNSYLEALKLQHQAQLSIAPDTRAIHQMNLPIALYIHTFTFLTCQELGRMLQVSKSYKDLAQDGVLWKNMYRKHYPLQAEMIVAMKEAARLQKKQEKQEQQQQKQHQLAEGGKSEAAAASSSSSLSTTTPPTPLQPFTTSSSSATVTSLPSAAGFTSTPLTTDPSIEDWYTIYKQRVELDVNFSPVVFDFGSMQMKVTLVMSKEEKGRMRDKRKLNDTSLADDIEKNHTPTIVFGSSIARVPGVYDLHMRQASTLRTFIGSAAAAEHPDWIYHPIEHGRCVHISVLPEFMASAYLMLSTWSHRHPLIIAEPPFQWSQQFKLDLTRRIIQIFRVPSISFVNSALLTAMGQGRPESAIVVNVGSETAWVSLINDYRQLVLVDFTLSMKSPNHEMNNDFFRRHQGELEKVESYAEDEDVNRLHEGKGKSSQSAPSNTIEITPELLAEGVMDAYRRAITLLTSSSSSSSTSPRHPPILGRTLHNVILSGGGTSAESFRAQFLKKLQALEREHIQMGAFVQNIVSTETFSKMYRECAKVSEFPMEKDEGQIGTEVAPSASSSSNNNSSTPFYIPSFELVFPFNPSNPSLSSITTAVDGGRIFGGLPQFQSYCISSFEFRHADSACDRRHSDLLYAHTHFWNARRHCWLWVQYVYSLIANHFHYDSIEDAYIGNTSCSDDELENVFMKSREARCVVYRRRTRTSGPRGKRKEPIRHWADQDKPRVAPPPREPSILRRSRRSAFPILPKEVGEWFDMQRLWRESTLLPPAPSREVLPPPVMTEATRYRPSRPFQTATPSSVQTFYQHDDYDQTWTLGGVLQEIRQRYGPAHSLPKPTSDKNEEGWMFTMLELVETKYGETTEREEEEEEEGEVEEQYEEADREEESDHE